MRCLVVCFLMAMVFSSCSKDPVIVEYKTENVVVIVVDGARYLETWGEEDHQFIRKRSGRMTDAVVCTQMYNKGITNTMNGHTALLTGRYEDINNAGTENPEFPSWLQYAQEFSGWAPDRFWIISSKDKLEALGNCTNTDWKDLFLPQTDCGVNGLNTGYRHDSTTFKNAKFVLSNYHPRFVLINFREPDYSAHNNDSLGYLQGIRDTDSMAMEIFNLLESDPFYAGTTTFIITNDHGRHLPGQGGYSGHGDNCEGCRHVEFFAIGPDFKKDYFSYQQHELIDIAATIAEITGIKMESGRGKVMKDILREYKRW